MTNYLKKYGNTPMFQQGGEMPTEPAAPAQGGADLEQMLMQVVQSQDPNLALQFCNMLAEQMGGGGQAPAAPMGSEPAAVPMGRRGMRLQPRFGTKGNLY